MGAIAVNARRNAALNPLAVYRDTLTMDDYLSARPISTPFGRFPARCPATTRWRSSCPPRRSLGIFDVLWCLWMP